MNSPSTALRALAPARLSILGTALVSLLAGATGSSLAQTALPQVVVTGTRFSEDAQTLPFGVSVITAREIERSGVSTVNEALMKLLGVPGRLDLSGGGDYALDLRGFGETAGSNQIVILDGLRLSEGDTSTTRLAGIAIDAVERIEVLRGSGSVFYGEGATGGVIVITTKAGRGVARATQGQVYAGIGSFRTRELRANATLAEGDFSFDVAGNKRQSDNHRDNFKSDAGGASVGVQWQGDVARVALRHAQDRLESGLPGELSAAEFAANPRQTFKPDDHARIRNAVTTLTAETRLGDWDLAGNLGYRDKSLRSLSTFTRGTAPSAYDYDVQSRTYGLRARVSAPLAELVHQLVLGVDGTTWHRDGLTYGDVAEQTNRGLYLRDEVVLPSATRLSAGVRREHVEKNISVNPQDLNSIQRAWELGAVQPLAPGVNVFTRVGNSFRLANVDEFAYKAPTTPLRPQTSRDLEVGVRLKDAASRAELRIYRSRLHDEIGYDPAQFDNVNFDATERRGVELDAGHSLTRTVQLRASVAWRDARFLAGTYAGKQLPLTSHRTASVGADWQVAAQHQLAANLFYASQRHPDFDNSCSMPSFTTLDLRYAYQLTAGELSVGVGNATDRKYYTQAFRCTAGVTQAIYPEAGRTVNAAARWRF